MTGHKFYFTRSRAGLGSPRAHLIIRRAAKQTLAAEGVDSACEMSVLLTDDKGIRRLNNDYRGKDMPTDVLSFPLSELIPGFFDPDMAERDPETGRILLGDMALSLERTRVQAAEYGHSEERELAYLAVHSVLHILGYDHIDEGENKRLMRRREKLIMDMLSIE